jgi:hypothetical protein
MVLSIVALMTETGIYDLWNIILIAVKMHSARHPGALGHAPNDMGILADISLLTTSRSLSFHIIIIILCQMM